MTTLVGTTFRSPLGDLRLVAREAGLAAIYFPKHSRPRFTDYVEEPNAPVLQWARKELSEFFAGTRHTFTVPLAPEGTPFQLGVWEALRAIPPGETRTYSALAADVGRRSAVRAVGAANGRNPLSIIVPCHRVIGADGTLTGYAGGLEAKEWLLAHEQRAFRTQTGSQMTTGISRSVQDW